MGLSETQLVRLTTLAFVIGLVSCSSSAVSTLQPNELAELKFGMGTASIGNLQRSQQGSTVSLQGKVISQAPLVGGSAFELQDATGSIWVMSKAAPPALGTEVTVQGTLHYQSLQLNGQEQGTVYVEQK